MSSGKCSKCPSYKISVGKLVTGYFLGLGAIFLMISMTVSDAGSTSTASSLKRILLNHMQLMSLALSYDLNWTPEIKTVFAFQGAFSTFGEQLLDAECILNGQRSGWKPFYVKQLMFSLFAPFLSIMVFIYWAVKEYLQHRRGDSEEVRQHIDGIHKNLAILSAARKKMLKHKMRNILTKKKSASAASFYSLHLSLKKKSEHAQMMRTLQELKDAGVTDIESASMAVRDRLAVGRMRAREFMEYVRSNNIDLKELFLKIEHEGPAGELTTEEFVGLLKTMPFKWPEGDYMCVAELFDVDGDDRETVSLGRITSFGKTFLDHMFLSLTVILYIMYPTNARMSFTQIACMYNLMTGSHNWYLRSDLRIGCDSPSHQNFVFAIGLPLFLSLVIIFPLFSVCKMKQSIQKHGYTHDTTMYRFAVFMSGYKRSAWYWEVVICARKLLLIAVGIFMKNFGTETQFFFAVMVIIFALALQLRMKPFATDTLNKLENSGLGIMFLSLFLGLFFFWESFSDSTLTLLALFIVAINVLYLLWIFGSIMVEYLHRHANSDFGKVIVLLKCKSENPLFLAFICIPCTMILLFILAKKHCGRLHKLGKYSGKKGKSQTKQMAEALIGGKKSSSNPHAEKIDKLRRRIAEVRSQANRAEEQGNETLEEMLRHELRALKVSLQRLLNENVEEAVKLSSLEAKEANKVTGMLKTRNTERKVESIREQIQRVRKRANAADLQNDSHAEHVARAELKSLKNQLKKELARLKWQRGVQVYLQSRSKFQTGADNLIVNAQRNSAASGSDSSTFSDEEAWTISEGKELTGSKSERKDKWRAEHENKKRLKNLVQKMNVSRNISKAGADLNARKEEWKRQRRLRKKQKKKNKKNQKRRESALVKHVEADTSDTNCNTGHALALSGRRPSNLQSMSVAERRQIRHDVLEKRSARQLGTLKREGTEKHF